MAFYRAVAALVRDADGVKRVPAQPFCNACKGYDLMPYDPENPAQQPLGDHPLPKWP